MLQIFSQRTATLWESMLLVTHPKTILLGSEGPLLRPTLVSPIG
jgi:hypothetical protein